MEWRGGVIEVQISPARQSKRQEMTFARLGRLNLVFAKCKGNWNLATNETQARLATGKEERQPEGSAKERGSQAGSGLCLRYSHCFSITGCSPVARGEAELGRKPEGALGCV